MNLVLRGRQVTEDDFRLIRSLLVRHGDRGRFFIARELCRLWNWTQPNGALKGAACSALLHALEDRGLIQLPARQRGPIRGRGRGRDAWQASLPFSSPPQSQQPMPSAIEWRLALRGPAFSLYKDLLQTHHYLGYQRAIGHTLRHIAYAEGRPIAALGWAAAAQKVACRDRFIGWTHAQRLKNLHRVACNTRFLVLPRIPHLASRLLASNIRCLAQDWQAHYGYAPVLLETFVDTTRFRGSCYKAANWIQVGLTQGRGKYDRYTRRPETIKAIYVYPLDKNFRRVLSND